MTKKKETALKNSSNKRSSPKVTVILTSYNHAAYITEAIQSVLDQTFSDFELLICDDGSTDNSHEIIKAFDDPRIKLFLYTVNQGPRDMLDKPTKAARGKYIAVHHSDDSWKPDKLAKQVAFLEEHEEYAACFTWVNFIDENSQIQELSDEDFYKNVFDQPNRSRAEWLRYFFYNANCLCHPSLLIRREAYEKYGMTETQGLWQLPDYFMWIQLCFHANFYIMPERLTNFRLRDDNMSATDFIKRVRVETEMFFVIRKFAENFHDDKFFLEVFPEAKSFVVNGKINRDFALAKICLKNNFTSVQFIGMIFLKKILSDKTSADEVKKLYDYGEKNFFADMGKFDFFEMKIRLPTIHTCIYFDTGSDFNSEEMLDKYIFLDSSGYFSAKYIFHSDKPIKFLRFDPDENFTSIKLDKVKINGVSHELFKSTPAEIVDGFYRFKTADPQFIFLVDNLSEKITFEIQGRREKDYFSILEHDFAHLTQQKELLERNNLELEQKNSILDAHVIALTKQNTELDAHVIALTKQNTELRAMVETLLNSTSWKITKPLRKLGRWIRYNNKDKALAVAHLVYQSIPINEETKTDFKNKFYTKFAPLLKNTQRYRNWSRSQNLKNFSNFVDSNSIHFFAGELNTQPGKIAIHAHIFYLDLLEEIAEYFSNMPYKFDALISIVDSSAEEKVQATFEKISNVEKSIVRVVPNRGRDVAPFIIGFGDLLGNYDFIAHFHSKKSLYTGAEQTKWRHYLFDALLGDTKRIKKIFNAFSNDKKVGLIYPTPAENLPYTTFTWLSNRQSGNYLLNRIGVPLNTTDYFDFPAGTMFWARSSALKKFWQSDLTIEDFPEEHGQNDGTFAHAFERSVALTTLSEEMDFYEFDPVNDLYTVNIGSKNLWQYYIRNETDVNWILEQNEIISFDIFDTLLMRYLAAPYLVNELIRLKVENFLRKNFDFPKFRLEAESVAREKNLPTLPSTKFIRVLPI